MSKLSSRAVRAQGSQELTVTSGLPGKDITAAFGPASVCLLSSLLCDKSPAAGNPQTQLKPPAESVTAPSDRNNDKVKPSDYLYFGEGSSGYHPRHTVANSTNQQGRASNGSRYTTAGSGNPSGRDNSGYLATGLNNNTQMGYSNLTYGGSLQYNFAGTQPIGVGT
ncbi:hypothetical protein LA080_008634 [Diaporthe eres]|nr:hypothetical protein LA080_008634 [Diaporthe eres]